MSELKTALVELMERHIVPAASWAFAWAASWFIGVDPALWSFIVFIVIDFVTALMAAYYQGKPITSRDFTRGFITKVAILILCLLGHPIENFVRLAGIPIELNLERWLPLGFTFGEILSVVENLYKCGVPIPAKLVEILINGKKVMPQTASKDQIDELFNQGEPKQ